jgi:hypothetical protein
MGAGADDAHRATETSYREWRLMAQRPQMQVGHGFENVFVAESGLRGLGGCRPFTSAERLTTAG